MIRRHDNRRSGGDSNGTSPEYNLRELPLEYSCSVTLFTNTAWFMLYHNSNNLYSGFVSTGTPIIPRSSKLYSVP
jgi:hypothetical protein